MRLDAHEIHAKLGRAGWVEVLQAIGIDEKFLRNRHGPCPTCGGKDRFRFDNKHGRGDWICNQCGAGDGFKLIMGAQGVDFKQARQIVLDKSGLREDLQARELRPVSASEPPRPAEPTQRVRALLRESCLIEDCEPVRTYLASRSLWPLPAGHGLRAHPSVVYWHEQQIIGRYPALLAAVRDMCGELVTVHATYLEPIGEKLQGFEARKLLSAMTGHEGCAVPLMPYGDTLGIAEGIETALSASRMHEVPVWAALNTSLLAKWEPPHTVVKVVVFADRDVAGLDAATKLMERLQERVRLVIKTPQSKDWNDALRSACA